MSVKTSPDFDPSLEELAFDRLLIAQALSEEFTIVSADPVFGKYGVKRVW